MKKYLFKFCLLFFLLQGIFLMAKTQSIAPFIINSNGGKFVNRGSFLLNNFSFVWSVGESSMIETFTTSNGSVILTHGVLQPFTEMDLQSIPIIGWTKDEVKLYPVPVNNLLQFDLYSKDTGNVVIQLFDILGNTLGLRDFQYNTLPVNQKIDFSKYASGTYLLKLSLYNKGALKKNSVFKIIKIR